MYYFEISNRLKLAVILPAAFYLCGCQTINRPNTGYSQPVASPQPVQIVNPPAQQDEITETNVDQLSESMERFFSFLDSGLSKAQNNLQDLTNRDVSTFFHIKGLRIEEQNSDAPRIGAGMHSHKYWAIEKKYSF